MFKLLSIAASLILASAAIAQSNQPGRTTPSVAPSSGAPIVGKAAPAPVIEQRPVGGLSKCENVLAFEKEKCLQDERAAGAGASGAPGGVAPR